MSVDAGTGRVRLDKWLWAARIFKTRGLAQAAIDNGRVLIGGERVKPARALRFGDEITVRYAELERVVVVRGMAEKRGSATIAQGLYEETAASIARREAERERRARAASLTPIAGGRPTKRERRRLDDLEGSAFFEGSAFDDDED